MTKDTKIWIIIGSSFLLTGVAIFLIRRNKRWDRFWRKSIYGVLAHEGGKSDIGGSGKDYTDLISLDGGTVGICHFASGGLCSLYKGMDTQKYFGKSEKDMCDNWASKTSGAYQESWWREGFKKFLDNPKNNKVQINVCKKSRQGAVDNAIKNGWRTDRELAIAVGVSNSYGNSGFSSKAKSRDWNAEKILSDYVNRFGGSFSSHYDRRRKMIDKWFPQSKEKNIA